MDRISKKMLSSVGLTRKEYERGKNNKFTRKTPFSEKQRILNAIENIVIEIKPRKKSYSISRKMLIEVGMTRKDLLEIKEDALKNFKKPIDNEIDISNNELEDFDFVEEEMEILKKIKLSYRITKKLYGNCVSEINFYKKDDESISLTIIFRKSDKENPIIMKSKKFIDFDIHKQAFIYIAEKQLRHKKDDDIDSSNDAQDD